MSGLPPLKLTLEKAAVSGLATKSDLETPPKPPTASKITISPESKLRTISQGKATDTIVRTKSKGGIKRSKRSKSKKNRRTRRR
jgi:hypothetical protein